MDPGQGAPSSPDAQRAHETNSSVVTPHDTGQEVSDWDYTTTFPQPPGVGGEQPPSGIHISSAPLGTASRLGITSAAIHLEEIQEVPETSPTAADALRNVSLGGVENLASFPLRSMGGVESLASFPSLSSETHTLPPLSSDSMAISSESMADSMGTMRWPSQPSLPAEPVLTSPAQSVDGSENTTGMRTAVSIDGSDNTERFNERRQNPAGSAAGLGKEPQNPNSFLTKSATNMSSIFSRAISSVPGFRKVPSSPEASMGRAESAAQQAPAAPVWVGVDASAQASVVGRYKEMTPVSALLKDLCEFGNFQFGEVWVRPIRKEQRQSLTHSDSLATSGDGRSLRRGSSAQIFPGGAHMPNRRRASATSTYNNSVYTTNTNYTRVESDRTGTGGHPTPGAPPSAGTLQSFRWVPERAGSNAGSAFPPRVSSFGANSNAGSELTGTTHRSLVPSLAGSTLKPRKPGSILKKSNSLQHWRNASQNKPPLPNWRSTNFLIPEASAEELEEESHGGGAGRGAGEGNEAGLNESRAHSSLSLRPLRADSTRTAGSSGYWSRQGSLKKADSFVAQPQIELPDDNAWFGPEGQRSEREDLERLPSGGQDGVAGHPGESGWGGDGDADARNFSSIASNRTATSGGAGSGAGVDSCGGGTASLHTNNSSGPNSLTRNSNSPTSLTRRPPPVPASPAAVVNNGISPHSTPEIQSPAPSRASSNPHSRHASIQIDPTTPGTQSSRPTSWNAPALPSESGDLKRLQKEGTKGTGQHDSAATGYRMREKKRKSDASFEGDNSAHGQQPSGERRGSIAASVKSYLSAFARHSNDRDNDRTDGTVSESKSSRSRARRRREKFLRFPGPAYMYESETHSWPDARMEAEMRTFMAEAQAMRMEKGDGELSPGRVWSAGDLVWEDITSMLHDDERLPLPRVSQQYILFQYSVGIPIVDDDKSVIGVMMLYRAGDKNKQHGYTRAEHDHFEHLRSNEELAKVLKKASQIMATNVKMQEELVEFSQLINARFVGDQQSFVGSLGRSDSAVTASSTIGGSMCLYVSEYFRKFLGSGTTRAPPGHDLRYSMVVLVGVFLTMLAISGIDQGLQSEEYRNDSLFALLASFAAVTSMVYCAPTSFFVQPRNIVGGHVIAACVAVALDYLVYDDFLPIVPQWVGVALAPAIASALMSYLGLIHPPAAALSVIYMTGEERIKNLGWFFLVVPVLLDCMVIIGSAVGISNISPTRSFPLYW